MPPLIESAARNGLVVAGFVVVALALCSTGNPLLNLLGMTVGLFGMVYLMRCQLLNDRRARMETGRGIPVAALASHGIATAFFAALPVALVVYVALRFIWPDLIVNQLEAAYAAAAEVPEAADMAATIRMVLDKGPVPGPVDMMASMLTMMMFTGLIIGIAGAFAAKFFNRNVQRSPLP